MTPKLYVLPGSHPCAAVEAALALKSIHYDRVDLLPMSQLLIGPLRYGGTTVPGMRLDGERLVGSRTIMRRLDALVVDRLVPQRCLHGGARMRGWQHVELEMHRRHRNGRA